MTTKLKDILQDLTDKLVIRFSPEKIYLFGSQAWGNPASDSDIDLLILLENSSEPKARRASIAYRAIREYANIPIDILVRTVDEFEPYSKIRATLQYKIANDGIVLYERRNS